jgi:hypothetical protein
MNAHLPAGSRTKPRLIEGFALNLTLVMKVQSISFAPIFAPNRTKMADLHPVPS